MPVYIYVYISTFYKNKFLETTQCIEFLSTFEGYIFIYIVCTELKGGGGYNICYCFEKNSFLQSWNISKVYRGLFESKASKAPRDWSHTNFLSASNGKLVKYRKIESSSPPHPTSYLQLLPYLG